MKIIFAIATLVTLVSSHRFNFQRALSVRDEEKNIISDTYISEHFELDNGAVRLNRGNHTQTIKYTHTRTHR